MRKLNIRFFLLMLVFWLGWSGVVRADYAISVNKVGQGQGTVTSTNDTPSSTSFKPVDINCGGICAGAFPRLDSREINVSLSAIPLPGSVFTGWWRNVYDPVRNEIVLNSDGSEKLELDKICRYDISCSITATQANQKITAKFELGSTPTTPVPFTVINAGSGSDYGRVYTSEKPSTTTSTIDCKGVKFGNGGNNDCAENYESGRSVTLNAEANKVDGAFFGGWEVYFDGDNLGRGRQTNLCLGLEPTCNITVPPTVKDIQVRAIFNLGYILTLQRQGEGAGSLLTVADKLQTACLDATCTETFKKDQFVEITAVTSANSKILGWTVDGVEDKVNCPEKSLTCTVTMNKAHLVVAKFGKELTGSFTATLLKEGSGTGFGTVIGKVISSNEEKINCGTQCSNSVNKSDAVRFDADPGRTPGVIFAGWKVRFWDPVDLKWVSYPDMCTGLQPVCEVTITQDAQVMARFDYDITLTVIRDGTGKGSVLSNSPALNKCSVDSDKNICEQSFVRDQEVTLTAITDAKSRFGGWTGACTNKETTCTVKMSERKQVTATFNDINNAKLTIKNDTPTGGTVKSDVGGGDCGGTKTKCAPLYALGTVVTLTAAPLPGWEFEGWDSDFCNGLEPTCKVTMKEDITVIAIFRQGFRLTVNKQGEGDGTIFSEPAGINCGKNCALSFNKDATVTLTAKPVNGSTFLGWGGACTGTQLTCTVAMNQAQTVAVTFSGVGLGKALDNTELTWVSTGDAPWSGQLEKDAKVKGIQYFNGSAGVSGLITHNQSTSVETTVTGPREMSFAWAVSSEKDRDELRFEMDGKEVQKISGDVDWAEVKGNIPAGKHVLRWTYQKDADLSAGADSAWLDNVKLSAASAGVQPNTLTIMTQGAGTVVSNPSGISCGGVCNADFSLNTAVSLTANAQAGVKFIGWTGACSGSSPTCMVQMNGAQTAVAMFQAPHTMTGVALNLGLLNDTGIDWCANKGQHFTADKEARCEALLATFPGQDGQEGRDAAMRKGSLSKIGSGDAGFDYTKICNNGQPEGESNCPANQAVAGTAANQWGCTRDNVTGLIWEVKTVSGLRDKDKTYTWYNPNDRHNGGSKGDNCTGAECNTDLFIKAVNQQGLCGANDWRLPTRRELHSMVHHGRVTAPAVDISSFPNTASTGYWTATPVAATPFKAWYVNFENGWDFWDDKANKQRVRLVRLCDSCELATAMLNPRYGNNTLHLPRVRVESDFYNVELRLITPEPMVFELNAEQAKKLPTGKSTGNDQARYYLNGLLVVNNIEVGADRYIATLQLVPGSNPLRFKLQSASVVR